jgi:hypothetical protein
VEELLAASPGVRALGPLAKSDYYHHLASAELLLYPCCFPEISCLAVLEAQALGTALVTTDGFALGESVRAPEFLVPGRPEEPEYAGRFLERALTLLADPAGTRELAGHARAQVRQEHDWDLIAGQWQEMFLARLGQRAQAQAPALAASLLLNGDLAAAEGLLQRPLPTPDEGPAPEDPDEAGLLRNLAALAWRALGGQGRAARVGVLSADAGRTALALARLMAPTPVEEIDLAAAGDGDYALVVVRDRLERDDDPAGLLARLEGMCPAEGHLLLCVASGAWPLIGPGHLGRRHDLGREELAALLPGRRLEITFLGRGLVRMGPARYLAGRWLALTEARGPLPGSLDEAASLRRVRPAPVKLLEEVRRAGLI